jgi:hypothetical protein
MSQTLTKAKQKLCVLMVPFLYKQERIDYSPYLIHSDDIEEFMDNNMIVDVNECENIFQHGVHGVTRRLRLLQQM